MSKILCIDASTEAFSVALLNGHEVTEEYQLAPRQHAQLILPTVQKLLQQSDILLNQVDAIACHVGPGAFTGIRIAVSVAQGLAYGANKPTIALSSLANLANQAFREQSKDYCLCAIDARMNEVYFAAFQRGKNDLGQVLAPESVIPPEAVDFAGYQESIAANNLAMTGSGWEAYNDQFNWSSELQNQIVQNDLILKEQFPRASASLKQADLMYIQGNLLSPEALQPSYLRNNVAKKKSIKK